MEPDCGYLFSVQWSATRPLVFAVGSADGHVIIYDLKVGNTLADYSWQWLYTACVLCQESHVKPCAKLDASPHHRPVYSVQYNTKRWAVYT